MMRGEGARLDLSLASQDEVLTSCLEDNADANSNLAKVHTTHVGSEYCQKIRSISKEIRDMLEENFGNNSITIPSLIPLN